MANGVYLKGFRNNKKDGTGRIFSFVLSNDEKSEEND
jgi:hypothetical protein